MYVLRGAARAGGRDVQHVERGVLSQLLTPITGQRCPLFLCPPDGHGEERQRESGELALCTGDDCDWMLSCCYPLRGKKKRLGLGKGEGEMNERADAKGRGEGAALIALLSCRL